MPLLDDFRLKSLKDQLNEQAREETQKLEEATKTKENKGRRKPKNK